MPEAVQLRIAATNFSCLDTRDRLVALLNEDLDFHNETGSRASHNFHSFPAKFPHQLPAKFISALTYPRDVVLDPMMGSGTTVLEAFLSGRYAIGFDIDPLALLISTVKITPVARKSVSLLGDSIVSEAELVARLDRGRIETKLENRWDSRTKQFVDYWFAPETQIELQALVEQIEKVQDQAQKSFLLLTLSAIIITKSGGVSLAMDLGHTRPHRTKVVVDKRGNTLLGVPPPIGEGRRISSKTVASPLIEFRRRLRKNLDSLPESPHDGSIPSLAFGNAQSLPLGDDSVDLIVTSPPYASNAIDYMRAHKFSLVWLGYPIAELSKRRKEYIGSEDICDGKLEELPKTVSGIVSQIGEVDRIRGRVLHRYYSEMTRTLSEMFRVLKPGKVAIVVVGTSTMRGINTQTGACLAEIGSVVGFDVPKVGMRSLDRNRRMLPIGKRLDLSSQIQNRMQEEFVIGLLKPLP
ncbi:MAG: DNA methyltransferase [Dehalococcoidales bacterium]|nr:DNA methyltransferase [Dehalococcoidales bacterium]